LEVVPQGAEKKKEKKTKKKRKRGKFCRVRWVGR